MLLQRGLTLHRVHLQQLFIYFFKSTILPAFVHTALWIAALLLLSIGPVRLFVVGHANVLGVLHLAAARLEIGGKNVLKELLGGWDGRLLGFQDLLLDVLANGLFHVLDLVGRCKARILQTLFDKLEGILGRSRACPAVAMRFAFTFPLMIALFQCGGGET